MAKKKKKITKKKAAKESKPKEKEARFDFLHRRFGTQGAKIDSVLSKKAKSIKEIVKESGLPVGRCKTHMRHMIKLHPSIIGHNKNGYFLKAKAS